MSVTYFEISYPNFVLGAIIDPVEANQNNNDIVVKTNLIVDAINSNETNISTLTTVKADKTYVDAQDFNLAGVGRTTQTIKANFDALVTHKTSGDHDSRYYTETEIDSKLTTINDKNTTQDSALSTHKSSTDHDNRYYTKEYLIPWLQGGDTNIKEEVFTIVNSNNGDGTFSYSNGVDTLTGYLTPEGGQIFNLSKGYYDVGLDRIESIINDTLRRSVASGGLQDVDGTSVILVSPEGSGAEITFKYYERIGMSAEYNIKLSSVKPPSNDGKTMWYEVII